MVAAVKDMLFVVLLLVLVLFLSLLLSLSCSFIKSLDFSLDGVPLAVEWLSPLVLVVIVVVGVGVGMEVDVDVGVLEVGLVELVVSSLGSVAISVDSEMDLNAEKAGEMLLLFGVEEELMVVVVDVPFVVEFSVETGERIFDG